MHTKIESNVLIINQLILISKFKYLFNFQELSPSYPFQTFQIYIILISMFIFHDPSSEFQFHIIIGFYIFFSVNCVSCLIHDDKPHFYDETKHLDH